LRHLAGYHPIENHTLHGYLLACGRNAEEIASMSAMPRKAAKYLVSFPKHLLNHPMNVGKGGAKRVNHLFKAFAPLLLARKRIEFHKINRHEIVRSLKPTLIDDFLNKTGDHCFVLRCCHGLFAFFSELLELCQSCSWLIG